MKNLRSALQDLKEYELIEMIADVLEDTQNHVEIPHISDPSHESGTDILSRGRDGKITAWCIKIKPRLEDLGQFIQFSNIQANRHLYLYIKEPVQSFKSETQKKIYRHVQFWGWKQISRFLIEQDSGRFFGRIMWNTKIVSQVIDILSNILKAEKLDSFEHLPRISRDEILRWLWNFKDRTVIFVSFINVLYAIVKDHIKEARIDNYALIKLILAQFDSLEKYYVQGIVSLVEEATKKPQILKLLYESVKSSSPWAFMFADVERYNQEMDKLQKEYCLRNLRVEIINALLDLGIAEAAEQHLYRLFHTAQAFELGADFTLDRFLQIYKQDFK